MPKSKKKTKTTIVVKKSASKRVRRKPMQTMGTLNHGEVETVCSMLNPFCPSSEGAKIHDQNSAKSLTFQSRNLQTVTVDTNGNAMLIISSSPADMTRNANLAGTSAVVTWGSPTTNSFYQTIGSACGSWRPVSFGFRFVTTQAWTGATGVLIITENAGYDIASTSGQFVNSLNLGTKSRSFALRDASVFCIGRTLGNTGDDYTTGVTTVAFNKMTNFIISISSATASTNVGYLDIVINYEWVPATNVGYSSLATQAAPSIPKLMDWRANAASTMDTMQNATDAANVSFNVMRSVYDAGSAMYRTGSVIYRLGKMAYNATPSGMMKNAGMGMLQYAGNKMLTNG